MSICAVGAAAADNVSLERLALCQDSWFEWKQRDPARLRQYAEHIRSDYVRKDNTAAVVATSPQTVLGLPVREVYPESIGMGVGFSVMVDATFDRTKRVLEQRLDKPFKTCEPPAENMRTCEMVIGDKKNLGLISEEDPKSTRTLFGCYYFYAK